MAASFPLIDPAWRKRAEDLQASFRWQLAQSQDAGTQLETGYTDKCVYLTATLKGQRYFIEIRPIAEQT